MHEHRIVNPVEQRDGIREFIARRRPPRAHGKVDQAHPVALARPLLQPIATGSPFAAQIHDGADAAAGQRADVVWGRLPGAPRFWAQAMPVEVDQAKDAMIGKQHVEVSGGGAKHLAGIWPPASTYLLRSKRCALARSRR